MKRNLYVLTCALCTLLSLPAAAQIPAYVPTDGLVGWWPFNGNANDESGNGNDGTVNGATLTEDRFGNAGKAYGFSNQSIIEVAHSPSLTFNEMEEFSVSFWHNKTSESSPQHFMGKRAIGSPIFNWQFGCETNETSFGTGIGPGQYNGAIYEVGQPSNTWQHLTGTYSNGTWTLYQNGLQVAFNNLAPSADSEAALTFGNSGGFESFHGSLDDIGIWNRALTEQEIQNLYTGTTPEPCAALPSNLQQGLVGYWPFCGNANDESGNGNDGTVNGAALTEDRFGNAARAYAFDGVDDYIVSDVQDLPIGNSERSISYWVSFNSLPSPGEGYYQVCYGSTEVSSIQGNAIGIANNTPIITWRYSNYGTQFIDFPDEIQINTWYHLVAVIDNEIAKLFINGEIVSESDASNWNTQLTDLFIGRKVDDDDYTPGKLDDIGIWNRALTPEEVQELYTLDACTFTVYDTTYVTVYDTLTTYEMVYDTLYTFETIYDTVTTYVTVTDTLLIDITFTGFEGQPSWLNTVTVFPNPASDHITIDYGNFALMAGYNTVIMDAAGATVYSSAVNSQQAYIDINGWGAAGVYYLTIYDANGEVVALRHIVLE